MMTVDGLKAVRGPDGSEVVRFEFRFGLPQVGGLRAAGYGLWAMGHWPLAVGREKVAGITSLLFRGGSKVCLFVILGGVWYKCDLC